MLKIFIRIVKEIYTAEETHNLAKDLLFDPIKSDLGEDTKEEVEKLEKKFFGNTDSFKISKDKFKPENMYFFES